MRLFVQVFGWAQLSRHRQGTAKMTSPVSADPTPFGGCHPSTQPPPDVRLTHFIGRQPTECLTGALQCGKRLRRRMRLTCRERHTCSLHLLHRCDRFTAQCHSKSPSSSWPSRKHRIVMPAISPLPVLVARNAANNTSPTFQVVCAFPVSGQYGAGSRIVSLVSNG